MLKLKMEEKLHANEVRNQFIGKGVVIGKTKNTGQYIVAVGKDFYCLNQNEIEKQNIGIQEEGFLYYQSRRNSGSLYFSVHKLPEVLYEYKFRF